MTTTSTTSQIAAEVPIRMIKGDHLRYEGAQWLLNGTPVDLTGWTVVFTVSTGPDEVNKTTLFEINSTDDAASFDLTDIAIGKVLLAIPSTSELADVEKGRHRYQMYVENGSGQRQTLRYGDFWVLEP